MKDTSYMTQEIILQIKQLEKKVLRCLNLGEIHESDITELRDKVFFAEKSIASTKTSIMLLLEEIEELNIAVSLILEHDTAQEKESLK